MSQGRCSSLETLRPVNIIRMLFPPHRDFNRMNFPDHREQSKTRPNLLSEIVSQLPSMTAYSIVDLRLQDRLSSITFLPQL